MSAVDEPRVVLYQLDPDAVGLVRGLLDRDAQIADLTLRLDAAETALRQAQAELAETRESRP